MWRFVLAQCAFGLRTLAKWLPTLSPCPTAGRVRPCSCALGIWATSSPVPSPMTARMPPWSMTTSCTDPCNTDPKLYTAGDT